jgi:transposase
VYKKNASDKMSAPLSKELRERIIIKHQKGIKPLQIQKELEIKSLSTVCAIINRYEETGSIEPRPLNNGRPPKMTPQNTQDLKAAVLSQPDITLEELKEQLNLPICISRICRILNGDLDLPYKKNPLSKKSKPSGCSQKT